MKILTIDFDIIMHPCIDVYNDSDLTADEYLNQFDFLGWMAADLELYKRLTNFIMSFKKDQIVFIYDHNDIVEEIKDIKEEIELINIDYHHDIGYDDTIWSKPLDESEYHEGNWVKYLWDTKKLKSYYWIKDYKSNDPPDEATKYLTKKSFYNSFSDNFEEFQDSNKIYVCYSPSWIPNYYSYLYDLWQDLTNMK